MLLLRCGEFMIFKSRTWYAHSCRSFVVGSIVAAMLSYLLWPRFADDLSTFFWQLDSRENRFEWWLEVTKISFVERISLEKACFEAHHATHLGLRGTLSLFRMTCAEIEFDSVSALKYMVSQNEVHAIWMLIAQTFLMSYTFKIFRKTIIKSNSSQASP